MGHADNIDIVTKLGVRLFLDSKNMDTTKDGRMKT